MRFLRGRLGLAQLETAYMQSEAPSLLRIRVCERLWLSWSTGTRKGRELDCVEYWLIGEEKRANGLRGRSTKVQEAIKLWGWKRK